jgi:hypothetical protein
MSKLFSCTTVSEMDQQLQTAMINGSRNSERALKKHNQVKSFDQILLDAVDEALLSLGENVETSIYFHLDDLFKIKKQEIPSKIEDFSGALTRIFGLGARSLEIMFMKSLHSKLELYCKGPSRCEWVASEVTFQEYVCLMRQKFEEATSKQKEIEVFVDADEKQEQYV